MRQIIKHRQIVADGWVYVRQPEAGAAALPARCVLPLAEFIATRTAALRPVDATGVWLAPADDIDSLVPWLGDLPLVAIEYTSSGEGRGYTQARLLRERHGFRGELRAFGAVRIDQVFLLARCGFDAFDLAAGENAERAIAQLERFSVAYQPGPDGLTHPRRRHTG